MHCYSLRSDPYKFFLIFFETFSHFCVLYKMQPTKSMINSTMIFTQSPKNVVQHIMQNNSFIKSYLWAFCSVGYEPKSNQLKITRIYFES